MGIEDFLGHLAKDEISKFKGVITSITFNLDNSIRVDLTNKSDTCKNVDLNLIRIYPNKKIAHTNKHDIDITDNSIWSFTGGV